MRHVARQNSTDRTGATTDRPVTSAVVSVVVVVSLMGRFPRRAPAMRHGPHDGLFGQPSPSNSATVCPSRRTKTRLAASTTSSSSDEMISTPRPSRGEFANQAQDLGLGADIDAAGRLVEDQQARDPCRASVRAALSAGCRRIIPGSAVPGTRTNAQALDEAVDDLAASGLVDDDAAAPVAASAPGSGFRAPTCLE